MKVFENIVKYTFLVLYVLVQLLLIVPYSLLVGGVFALVFGLFFGTGGVVFGVIIGVMWGLSLAVDAFTFTEERTTAQFNAEAMKKVLEDLEKEKGEL